MTTGKGYFKLFRGLCLHTEISLLSQQAELSVISVLREECNAERKQKQKLGSRHERQMGNLLMKSHKLKPEG